MSATNSADRSFDRTQGGFDSPSENGIELEVEYDYDFGTTAREEGLCSLEHLYGHQSPDRVLDYLAVHITADLESSDRYGSES